MMTSSNGNIFHVTGPLQRQVTRSFDIFFDLRPNKRLCKQSRGWWFETSSCSLWRHCNAQGEHGMIRAIESEGSCNSQTAGKVGLTLAQRRDDISDARPTLDQTTLLSEKVQNCIIKTLMLFHSIVTGTGPVLARLCGYQACGHVTSSSNSSLYLTFRSDGSVEKGGFFAKLEVTGPGNVLDMLFTN